MNQLDGMVIGINMEIGGMMSRVTRTRGLVSATGVEVGVWIGLNKLNAGTSAFNLSAGHRMESSASM